MFCPNIGVESLPSGFGVFVGPKQLNLKSPNLGNLQHLATLSPINVLSGNINFTRDNSHAR